MERLLLIGLHTVGSGLTSVGMSLASALSTHYLVGYLGIEHLDGQQRLVTLPYAAFTEILPFYGTRFLVDQGGLDAAVNAFDPGWILVIGPPFLAHPLLTQLQRHRTRCRVALYAAIETELTDPLVLDVLCAADTVLTYCDFARNSIFNLASRSGQTTKLPSVSTVGHGITEPSRFRPLLNRRRDRKAMKLLREQALPDIPVVQGDTFLILNANRAYMRKRLDLSVKGFAIFLQLTDANAHLYLHALWIRDVECKAIEEIASSEGIANRVHITPHAERKNPRTDEALNLLYNAADVGLNTAMGEGWGLASFEHALTAAPQVVPAHTGLQEHWNGAAELVPALTRHPVFYEYGEMFAVSPQGVAESIHRLYNDPEYYTKMGEAARVCAESKEYSWKYVSNRIAAAFNASITGR